MAILAQMMSLEGIITAALGAFSAWMSYVAIQVGGARRDMKNINAKLEAHGERLDKIDKIVSEKLK